MASPGVWIVRNVYRSHNVADNRYNRHFEQHITNKPLYQIRPIFWNLQSLPASNSKVNPCLLRRESIEAESQKEKKKQRRKEKVEVVQGREPLYHENL